MSINYPVVLYTNKYIRGMVKNENSLFVASGVSIDTGYFDNGVIIDSNCNRYEVLAVKKVPFYKFSFLRALKLYFINWGFIGTTKELSWADITLSAPQRCKLNDIKKELLNVLLSHPKWYSHYQQETEVSIKEYFKEAKTIEELINNISIYP